MLQKLDCIRSADNKETTVCVCVWRHWWDVPDRCSRRILSIIADGNDRQMATDAERPSRAVDGDVLSSVDWSMVSRFKVMTRQVPSWSNCARWRAGGPGGPHLTAAAAARMPTTDPSTYGLFAYFLFRASKSNPICDVRTAVALSPFTKKKNKRAAFFLSNLLRLRSVGRSAISRLAASVLSRVDGRRLWGRRAAAPDQPLTVVVMAFLTSFIPTRVVCQSRGAEVTSFAFARRRHVVRYRSFALCCPVQSTLLEDDLRRVNERPGRHAVCPSLEIWDGVNQVAASSVQQISRINLSFYHSIISTMFLTSHMHSCCSLWETSPFGWKCAYYIWNIMQHEMTKQEAKMSLG